MIVYLKTNIVIHRPSCHVLVSCSICLTSTEVRSTEASLASQTQPTPAQIDFGILPHVWYWKWSMLGLVGSGLQDKTEAIEQRLTRYKNDRVQHDSIEFLTYFTFSCGRIWQVNLEKSFCITKTNWLLYNNWVVTLVEVKLRRQWFTLVHKVGELVHTNQSQDGVW